MWYQSIDVVVDCIDKSVAASVDVIVIADM